MGYFKNTLRSLDRPLAENLMGRGVHGAVQAKADVLTESDARELHGVGERLAKMREALEEVERLVAQATPEERQEIRNRAAELF